MITKSNLDREASRYSRRISNAPGQERADVSIARQQEIKAELYLMFLQKREENAIALAATANNAKIIDEAIADDTPVSPKRSMIYLIALHHQYSQGNTSLWPFRAVTDATPPPCGRKRKYSCRYDSLT